MFDRQAFLRYLETNRAHEKPPVLRAEGPAAVTVCQQAVNERARSQNISSSRVAENNVFAGIIKSKETILWQQLAQQANNSV